MSLVICTLAIFALALPVYGSEKNPVERPVKGRGEIEITASLLDGSFSSPNWGESTVIGRYTNIGHGVLDPTSGAILYAHGTIVAANGDQINWTQEGPSGGAVFTGGTGRFEAVTGGFSWQPAGEIEVTLDLEKMTMTMRFAFTLEGTIRY